MTMIKGDILAFCEKYPHACSSILHESFIHQRVGRAVLIRNENEILEEWISTDKLNEYGCVVVGRWSRNWYGKIIKVYSS